MALDETTKKKEEIRNNIPDTELKMIIKKINWYKENENRTVKRIRQTWRDMHRRCYNTNHSRYKWYGGKGIKICNEWLGEMGFCCFFYWAINNGYNNRLTIDRIDVNVGYSPNNCRWVDHKTQQRNRRNTHYVEYNGENKSIGEWAEIININYNTLLNRINKGWDIKKALTTRPLKPPVKKNKY